MRQRVWKGLIRTHQSAARLDRFANCGSCACVQYSATEDRFRIAANHCHDRMCLRCGQTRSRQIAAVLLGAMKQHHCRFVTLTMRHNDTPLKEQIDRLYRSFAALRRRPFWKSRVLGGAAFLEVKTAKDGRHWHPHLHIICIGEFLPVYDLGREWHHVTGDSHVVDVRSVTDLEEVHHYVTKYASKPMDSSVCASPVHLDELIVALKGRRMVLPFGRWRKLNFARADTGADDWCTVESLSDLLRDAQAGDLDAQAILARVSSRHDHAHNWPPSPDG